MATIGEISRSISDPHRQTYYFIINYAYDHGGAIPSLREMARSMRIPWQTLVYRMNTLCQVGLIRKIGCGRSMTYELAGAEFSINFHSQPFVSAEECMQTGDENEDYAIPTEPYRFNHIIR